MVAWQHLHNTNGSDKEDVLQGEAVCSQSSPPSPHCANINWHTVTRGRRAADPDTEGHGSFTTITFMLLLSVFL